MRQQFILNSMVLAYVIFSTQAALAAQVVANGTTVDMNGTSASTTTNGDPAILSTNSGQIHANGATATTSGSNANGATATLNGSILFNGSSVFTSGTSSYGLYADQGGFINASGTFISTTGTMGHGINAGNGGTILLGGPSIQTAGLNAYGVVAMAGGTITGSANVTTNGNGGAAVYALGGHVTYNGGSIVTNGIASVGLGATSAGVLSASGFSAQTKGDNAAGVAALGGSQVSISGANVQTLGTGSFGAFSANAASNITFSNGSLQTFGSNASGIAAVVDGTVSLTNASLTTSGANAPAVYLSGGGTANIVSANATAQGTGSAGLLADSTYGAGSNTFNLTNGSIYSASADAIRLDVANVTVNANRGTINANPTGSLVFATNGAVGNINGDNNSHFTGTINADASTVNLALSNSSTWTGRSTSLNDLSIDASSEWDMTQSSIVNGTANIAGTIDIAAPLHAINTLTFNGVLNGQNGNIIVETTLNSDNSPSDVIRIGGTSQGSTALTVNNFRGQGQETNQGILVVNSTGGTVGTGSFYLKNAVVAGPYEYLLYRQGNNLYLRNTAPTTGPTSPPDITGPSEGGGNGGGGGGSGGNGGGGGSGILPAPPPGTPLAPIYRPDVSLAPGLPSIGVFYNNALLGKTGTLHQRAGQPFYLEKPDTTLRKWIRDVYEGGLLHNGTIYDAGPNFNYHTRIVQLGADVDNRIINTKHHLITGLFGAVGNVDSNVDSPFGGTAGHNQLNALSFGAYFTYLNQNRWYLDAVVQGSHYRFDANSYSTSAMVTNGMGFAGSLEGGYRYPFLTKFAIEPQAQMVVQTLSLRDTSAQAANIRFNRTNPYAGRLGLLGEYSFNNTYVDPMTLWIRGNYWRQFNGNAETAFSSGSGYIPFYSAMPENTLEGEIGMSATVMKHAALFGTFSRSYFTSQHGNSAVAVLGINLSL